MKKQVSNEFAKLRDALHRYTVEIESVLSAYRSDLAAARQRADQYKDSKGELERARQELVAPARAHIAAADQSLAKAAREVAGALRKVLSQRVAERPDGEFVALLKAYNDLGVKLSAGEIRALLPSAEGNYLALKALAAVAEKSGCRLTTPSLDEYEKTVRDIEQLCRVPIMFAPMEFVHEGADVLADQPRFAPDGRWLYSMGRPSASYLALQSNYIKTIGKRIDEAADRWAVDFVPELSELQPIRDTAGRTLMNEEQQRTQAVKRAAGAVELDEHEAERVAEELNETNEKAEQRAAEIRAQFERK